MASFLNATIAQIREHLEVGAYAQAGELAERLRQWCAAQAERRCIEKLPPVRTPTAGESPAESEA